MKKIKFPTLFLEKYFLENIILFPTDRPTTRNKNARNTTNQVGVALYNIYHVGKLNKTWYKHKS